MSEDVTVKNATIEYSTAEMLVPENAPDQISAPEPNRPASPVSDRKKLIRLGMVVAVEFLLIFVFVLVFDPFYQYHGPLGDRPAVLFDRDNQMAGSIRNFTYDSVLVGSSVVENSDSTILDEAFDCQTLKVIRASGSMADLLYYLEMAREKQEIKNVFWGLDLLAVNLDVNTTMYNDEVPRYLHTETILDDYTYIFNKEILMETIPMALAYELTGRNVDGKAYDWSGDKVFSAEQAMRVYGRPDEVLPPADFSENKVQIDQNIAMLKAHLDEYPETAYRFFFAPYSMCWWDSLYVNGQSEEWFYILEQLLQLLTAYENVEVYYYQDEQEIVCNLDNFMDFVHFKPEINQYIMEQICLGEGRVTAENWRETIAGMRKLAGEISEEYIYQYYPR